MEGYSKFVIDNDLLPDHLKKEKNIVKAEMFHYSLYPVGMFCLGAVVIVPVFFSRNTAQLLKKLVIAFCVIQGGVNGNNRFNKSFMNYDQKCYPYYPTHVKLYKMTHDYRHLALMDPKVENYDPVTKIPNF